MLCARALPGPLTLSVLAPIAIAQTAVGSNSFDVVSVKTGDPSFRGMSMHVSPSGLSVSGGPGWIMLTHLLSNATGRMVIDRTGLNGAHDFNLQWTPDPGEMGIMGPPPPGAPSGEKEASPAADGPSLFTAVQEQLGLRLEATKGPVQVVVVDHVEKPSAN